MLPAGLLALTLLAPGQAPASVAPSWQKGDELTYVGSVTEFVDRPGIRFRRAHDLEVRVFVLEVRTGSIDAAVLTLLRRADDVVTGAVGTVTGAKPERAVAPPAARLDLVRVRANGVAELLLPRGPMPLDLGFDTPTHPAPAVPRDTFASFEFGMFSPRPGDTWKAAGSEAINAASCTRLVSTSQTPTWDQPVGGEVAWQRVGTVWVSERDGTVRRVHRIDRQRDGLNPTPAVVVEVKYDLKDHAKIGGRTYDRYRREVEFAYTTRMELLPLLPDAARLGPKPFEDRIAKVNRYLDESLPGTPYREAVLAVRRQLDAARRGDVVRDPVEKPADSPPAPARPTGTISPAGPPPATRPPGG